MQLPDDSVDDAGKTGLPADDVGVLNLDCGASMMHTPGPDDGDAAEVLCLPDSDAGNCLPDDDEADVEGEDWAAVTVPRMLDFSKDGQGASWQKCERQHDFVEIFSAPRLCPYFARMGYLARLSIDLVTGHDLAYRHNQEIVMSMMRHTRPKAAMLSPPCTVFSTLQNLNMKKMSADAWQQKWNYGLNLLEFSMELAKFFDDQGKGFVFEHPASASSWRQACVLDVLQRQNVLVARFHQCRYGLKSPGSKLPMRKNTMLMTNLPSVQKEFHGKFCKCSADHCIIEGSEAGVQLSEWAQQYPPKLCKALFKSIQSSL